MNCKYLARQYKFASICMVTWWQSGYDYISIKGLFGIGWGWYSWIGLSQVLGLNLILLYWTLKSKPWLSPLLWIPALKLKLARFNLKSHFSCELKIVLLIALLNFYCIKCDHWLGLLCLAFHLNGYVKQFSNYKWIV